MVSIAAACSPLGSGPVTRVDAISLERFRTVRADNKPVACDPDEAPDTRPGRYYVTVREGNRHGYLLGPYDTHAEALSHVQRGSEYAAGVDVKAHWYAFGTGRLRDDAETVKSVFGY
jgi:hypothetical protein